MRRALVRLAGLISLLTACAAPPTPAPTPIPWPTLDTRPAGPGDPVRGAALFAQTLIGDYNAPGCITCHSPAPDVVLVGPPAPGLAARAEARLASGDYTGAARTVEDYLRESILAPQADLVPGFSEDQMYGHYEHTLTTQAVADLVAYLLTLR